MERVGKLSVTFEKPFKEGGTSVTLKFDLYHKEDFEKNGSSFGGLKPRIKLEYAPEFVKCENEDDIKKYAEETIQEASGMFDVVSLEAALIPIQGS